MNRTTHNESSAPMKKYSELTIDELATHRAVIQGAREVEQVVGGAR